MKSYIQDLCGDEDTVVIDCAILSCFIQDTIFEKLVGSMMNNETIDKTHDVIWDFLSKHQPKTNVSICFLNLEVTMSNVIPLVKKPKVSKVYIQMQVEALEDDSLWYRWLDPKTGEYVEWRRWEEIK